MVGSFSSIDEARSGKMIKISEPFRYKKDLESAYSGRIMYFTSYTSNAIRGDFNKTCFINKTSLKSCL